MSKVRKRVFDKHNGRCSYCGCELQKGWHVDELLPVRRNIDLQGKYDGTMMHPERLNIDNQMPSCPSCNINKHSMSLDEFRHLISNFVNSLNKTSVQYRMAKKYGLVEETPKEVVFYFEHYEHPNKTR